MKKSYPLYLSNIRWARSVWGKLDRAAKVGLRELTQRCGLSVIAGDLQFLGGRWYVTHAGLLRLAQRRRCLGITASLLRCLSDSTVPRWVFKATVYKSPGSKGFVGYGDADPSNVSLLVRGAEMRVAETRAVNRALRKAYGIGLCSVEELGAFSPAGVSTTGRQTDSRTPAGNGSGNGQPRVRDRFCLLIRQHQLDPTLVKRYAAEFCGTQALREASREQIEAFISHLAEWAAKDREGLLCKLNSFAQTKEVNR